MALERAGVPVVFVCTDAFVPLAEAVAGQQGFPELPRVELPHPIGGRDPGELRVTAKSLGGAVAAALCTAPGRTSESAEVAEVAEMPDDPGAFTAAVGARGWGDGLPLLVPSVERVEDFLAASGIDPATVIGPVPPEDRLADARTLAANALMAGCDPMHLPVVVAALVAMLESPFNLEALQTTTHPVTPLVVVHGAAVDRLGFNAGPNTYGQGTRANAATGRAVRLVLQHVGGARPGATDRATHGTPAKYSACIAELADAVPWPSLAAARGVDAPEGAVTVIGCEGPHNVNDHGSDDADGLIGTIAGTLASLGSNNLYLRGQPLLVLSPEHAELCVRAGLDRQQVGAAVRARARVPVSAISPGNLTRFKRINPGLFDPPPGDGLIPMLDADEDLLICVAGGPGKHSMIVPTFGTTDAVTVSIADAVARAAAG